jgi:5,10-methenyltetrahydromethanopterin hydrogenase
MPQFFDCTDECFLLPLDMGTAIGSPSMATSGNILAYGELESLQGFKQLPTSHPCLDESALVLTDIFDMQGYYGMETEVPDDLQVGKLKPKSRNRSPINNY